MNDLLQPGSARAGALFTDEAFLAALVKTEEAWLHALVGAGVAPWKAAIDLMAFVPELDMPAIAAEAETGGNPVIPLVCQLRGVLGDQLSAVWLHRGLTSQDVVDTALMLCVRDSLSQLLADFHRQVAALMALIQRHTGLLLPARTLTQYAVPTTFAAKAGVWLACVLDAAEDVQRCRGELQVQAGGAAGTAAALVELARLAGRSDPLTTALVVVGKFAQRLGLLNTPPWHTARRPLTRVGDALTASTDSFGRIANDVATLSRPEIRELAEGRGGESSTMPQKQNPVLSVLIRSAALEAPLLGAQLHLAAAQTMDERPDGAWHAEWIPLRTLTRGVVVAAGQTSDLLENLVVHEERMTQRVEAAGVTLLAERDSVRQAVDAEESPSGPADYLGANDAFVESILERARGFEGHLR